MNECSNCEVLLSEIVELKEKLQDSEDAYKDLHEAMDNLIFEINGSIKEYGKIL